MLYALAELRIKIKSLADEIATIHRDERKFKRKHRRANLRRRFLLEPESMSNRALREALGERERLRGLRNRNFMELDQPPPTAGVYKMNPTIDEVRRVLGSIPLGTHEQNFEISNGAGRAWLSLAEHRVHLRSEFRSTLLAYAFLRGRSYETCEQFSRTQPDWARVKRIVAKFGSYDQWSIFEKWVEDAKNYIACCRDERETLVITSDDVGDIGELPF